MRCLTACYKYTTRTEIREASFVAAMADDTTNGSEDTQMVLVLLYALKEEIFEQFGGILYSRKSNCR